MSHRRLGPQPHLEEIPEGESEQSLESETLNKEDCYSPISEAGRPLKVLPAPPPNENAWFVKPSSNPPPCSQSSGTEEPFPTRHGEKVAPAQPSEERPSRKKGNKMDGVSVPRGQRGNSRCGPGNGGNQDHWRELAGKDGTKSTETPRLHRSQRNLTGIHPPGSPLQARMLLSLSRW